MSKPLSAVLRSSATLRPTTADDLPAISDLTDRIFGRRRSEEVLEWLLLSGDKELALQSRVAITDGRVIGHAAVLASRYQWGGRTAEGGHGFLWMLEPGFRGRIGVQLGTWCSRSGDFHLVVGGTQKSKPIMERRGFVRSATTTELRLPTQAISQPRQLELRGYEPCAPTLPPVDGPVINLPSPARLRWLAGCPGLESRLCSIFAGDENLGPLLLFVNRRREKPSGRIVHLPWNSEYWDDFVRLALGELASLGCESASLLATCEVQLQTALALGGVPFYERLIFFRNQSGLPEPSSWHLSYLEGDLAYRRV